MRAALALSGLACLLLVTTVAARQSARAPEVTEGRLEAVGPDGAPRGTCPLRHTDVKAEVSGFLARVTVTQRFENPFGEPIEAVYLFPLPNDAAVDGMTMRVGDRVIRGEIKRRAEARAIYEAARAEGKVASLLEQQRPNVFAQSVANILPGAGVEVEITYVETLRYENGAYEFVFPMTVGRRYLPVSMQAAHKDAAAELESATAAVGTRAGHDVSVEVRVEAGVPIEDVRSTLHDVDIVRDDGRTAVVTLKNQSEIPNRDFVMKYKVAGGRIEDAVLAHRDERGGFFTLILQPPDATAAEDVTPKELVFVLDTSGSMSGFPIEKAKECIHLALENLYPEDTFNLITFAGATRVLFPQPVPATKENLEQAMRFLAGAQGSGGTEMMQAIQAALEPSDRQDHMRVVCFMTDGYVGNDFEILGEIQKHENARVFSFGIGDSVNRFLLDKMAEEGRGEVEYVTLDDDGSAAARRFFERVRNPLLTDVSVDWGGLEVSETYPSRIPDLFGAKPVVVTGRYASPGRATVKLRGRADGREVEREIAVELPDREPDHDAIATLWARRKVDDLMRQDYFGMLGRAPKDGIGDAIAELGVTYHLMTQFTSFVAVAETPATAGGDVRRVNVASEAPEGVDESGGLLGVGIVGGRTAETVTVTAGEPMMAASYGESVLVSTSSDVVALPISGRSPLALASIDGVSTGDVAVCAQTVAGQRSAGSSVVLDGTDNGDVPPGVSNEAVQEVRVRTSEFTAEYGAASSGTVDVVTKAGTNEFHGSVYEFNRTSGAASQPFAEKAVTAPVPEGVFARNQFGFTFGGPVVRDKLFFFGAAEWLRVRSTRNAAFLVPTAELLAASSPATRAFFDAFTPRPGIDARTVRAGDVPLAGLDASLPIFTERYVAVCGDTGAGVAQNTSQSTIRMDWNINDRTTAVARYGLDRSTLFPGAVSVSPYAGFDTGAKISNDAVEATLTRVFSSENIGVTTFGFERREELRPLGVAPVGPSLYLLPRPFVPFGNATAPVALPGYLPVAPGDGLPSGGPRFEVRVGEDLTFLMSKHELKVGGIWSRRFDDRDAGAYREPVVSLGRTVPAALDNLLAGSAFRVDAVVDPAATGARAVRYDEAGFYVNDKWKVTPRVTLNLGVRYDVFGVPHDAEGRDANFFEGPGATELERIASGDVASAADGLYAADRNNWAPRLGVAWDVAGDGLTVVRGGYGIVYQRVADLAGAVSYQNPPNFAVAQVFGVPLGAVPEAGPIQLRAVDERLRNPYTQFWNLAVEREVGKVVVSVDYAGSKGKGLASVDDVNRLPARLNPTYGDIWQLRNSGTSITNGVSFGVESRRLDPLGLQLSARYTWAHAIDNVTVDGSIYGFSPGLLDPFDPRLDRGDANTDVRHRFAMRGVWDMPFGGDQDGWRKRLLGGWTVTWVFDARTGTPFTVYDCTNAIANCARLVEIAPADRDGASDPAASMRAADLATGDRYVFVDLASQLAGRGAYAGSGPFPAGMTARNAFRAPGTWNLDGAVVRTIAFNERVSLELRVEGLDVSNHANLFVSRGEADISQSSYVPAFFEGRRQVQFGAKLTF